MRRALGAERRDAHVARVDGRLRRAARRPASRIESSSVRPVAAGQVGPPDRALEQHVAREERLLVGDREGHVAGAVAGREEHVDLESRQLQLLAARRACARRRSSRRARSPATARSALMSASTGFSISGTQTSAPVALATGATAPTWSKWVCVSRMPVQRHAELRRSRRAASSPRRRGRRSARGRSRRGGTRKQFSGDRPDGEHADVHGSRFWRLLARWRSCRGAGRCSSRAGCRAGT